MRLSSGDIAPKITLQDLNGQPYTLSNNNRLTLIAFHRFAGCPICNLRVSQLIARYPKWKDQLEIVVIFDSSVKNLQRHMLDQLPPFNILADQENEAYKAYGIEYSWLGAIKGTICRFPTIIKALRQGFIPKSLEGKKSTMPASFIVNPNGTILVVYYGQDEGDYLPIDQIDSFLAEYKSS